jgi:hypothetical protein
MSYININIINQPVVLSAGVSAPAWGWRCTRRPSSSRPYGLLYGPYNMGPYMGPIIWASVWSPIWAHSRVLYMESIIWGLLMGFLYGLPMRRIHRPSYGPIVTLSLLPLPPSTTEGRGEAGWEGLITYAACMRREGLLPLCMK